MNQLEEFKALGLSDDILTAIAKKGFETPSAIQSLTIPHLLTTDKDIIAQAQTGTGKTAAFGLPIIQMLTSRRNIPQAIVLVPTRELALQVTQELISFNTHDLSIAPIYGGASMTEQLRRLKKGIDIVVGTPGRILDHIRRGTLDLSAIAYLVLDEADEMLNMGFIEDIEEIMHAMTGPKRVLLFSATMPDRIAALARNYMHEPDLLKVESQHVTTDLTNQIYFEVREGDKFDALTRIIDVEPEFYGIVFSRTRTGADDIVAKLLERGYAAEVLHGDISQAQREKILGKFKKKQVNILVATDVAARGIDVSNLTHVINYSLPQDSDSYVHRIGRTGRAGNQGTAITFISPSEMRKFGFLKRTIKADIKLEQLPTPADIIATKRNKIKEDLDAIVESESYGECTGMAAELLENYPPEVALSALLRLAFKNELSESSYPEIRSIDVDRKGKARIFLAFGARDGYDTRKTVRLLKQECGLSDHDIDDVRYGPLRSSRKGRPAPEQTLSRAPHCGNIERHPLGPYIRQKTNPPPQGVRHPIRTQNRQEARKQRHLRAGGTRRTRRSERTSEIRPQPKNVRHESREETRNDRQSGQQNVHTGENRREENSRAPRKLVRKVVRPAATRPQQKRAEPDPEAKKQRLNIKPAPRPRRVVRPQEIWRS